MRLIIELKMDNAAFGDDSGDTAQWTYEAGRILREYGKRMERDGEALNTLVDYNGNRVGTVRLITVEGSEK